MASGGSTDTSTSSTTFRPLNENTIAIKIYCPFGLFADYTKLHYDIDYALANDLGCTYGIILYAQSGAGSGSGSIYLQYANNDLGPATDTEGIILIEYYCPRTVGVDLTVLKKIHSTIVKALDPNNQGLKIKYMIMNNVNMSALDAPFVPKVSSDGPTGSTD